MKKFGEWVVKLRIPIIILSLLLLIPSAFGFINTRINYDILSYLPSDLETMKGQDVLLSDFGKGAYSIFVCNGMKEKDVIKLREEVENIDHVASVLSYDTLFDPSIPLEVIPDEIKDIFYSSDKSGTLMFIFFDTTTSADETLDAVQEIRAIAGENCFLAGMSGIVEDTKLLIMQEVFKYVAIATVLAAIVLALALDSFLVPFIILINIGMAIVYNLGTNVFKGEISFVTMALVAVLQLGVTMDYSIFLYSSFKEQKSLGKPPKEAMASAIAATFVSVTGSSLTTIAGFIALCFMSFTLGMDLGIVMAKGVVLGVIGCVTILPSLMLCFDKAIVKTTHKSLNINFDFIGKFVSKHAPLLAVIMIVLWIPAIYGNANYKVYYKLDTSLPDTMNSVQANIALEQYEMSSISMVLVDKDLPARDTREMIDSIEAMPGINFAMGLDSITRGMIPDSFVPDKIKDVLESDNWKLIMFSSQYEVATDEVNEQCANINKLIKQYDPNAMLIGETACTKDLIDVCDHDFQVVNWVSIGAIFILLLFVLKSPVLPIILVLVIELAIFINMGMSYYLGQTLPFIASVCVGTIQLGATVDYAILMTNRYKVERIAGKNKYEATKIALDTSMHSIATSAFGMFAATVGVGLYSSADIVGSICILLGRGAIISMVVVILLLPPMYILLDGLIIRTTVGMKGCIKHKHKKNEEMEAAAK